MIIFDLKQIKHFPIQLVKPTLLLTDTVFFLHFSY